MRWTVSEKRIDDGGPAFPESHPEHPAPSSGMTLRDYFAGQALAGFGANPPSWTTDHAILADACYKAADAMLAARKESPNAR